MSSVTKRTCTPTKIFLRTQRNVEDKTKKKVKKRKRSKNREKKGVGLCEQRHVKDTFFFCVRYLQG